MTPEDWDRLNGGGPSPRGGLFLSGLVMTLLSAFILARALFGA